MYKYYNYKIYKILTQKNIEFFSQNQIINKPCDGYKDFNIRNINIPFNCVLIQNLF